MPVLGNAKQELYAKHRANGFIPKKAAVAAGYATGSSIYTSLEADENIVARIHELIDERNADRETRRAHAVAEGLAAGAVAGAISGVDHAWVLQQLRENAVDAAQRGDFKESNSALKLIGDHLGMFKTTAGDNHHRAGGDDDTLTMDSIDKLTRATEHLIDTRTKDVEIVDVDLAMRLIEGGSTPIPKKTLGLDTGSETDVALQDDHDAEFEDIPPNDEND